MTRKSTSRKGTPQPRALEGKDRFAFSFIIEALTQGLYPNVFDVLREYVQNAYDAVLRECFLNHLATNFRVRRMLAR